MTFKKIARKYVDDQKLLTMKIVRLFHFDLFTLNFSHHFREIQNHILRMKIFPTNILTWLQICFLSFLAAQTKVIICVSKINISNENIYISFWDIQTTSCISIFEQTSGTKLFMRKFDGRRSLINSPWFFFKG